jgi:HEAT repeat protein
MGPKAVPELIQLLQARDQKFRLAVRNAASRLPVSYRTNVYQRIPVRHAGTTRMLAARGLGLLGTNAVPAIPALAEAMQTTDNNSVRWFAAEALGRTGPAAIDSLVTASTDARDPVRHAAVYALGVMKSNALPAYPAIERRFADEVEYIRNSACHTAFGLGPEAIPLLLNSLSDTNPLVREMARKALTNFRVTAHDAVPLLQSQSTGMEPEELVDTIETIGKIWAFEPETVEWLAAQADHSDEQVRLAALKTLVTVGRLAKPHEDLVRKHLVDENPEVRKTADFLVRILEAVQVEPRPEP